MTSTTPAALLAGLPARGRTAVLGAATPRRWSRGELLTLDGEDASSLMVLTEGHVLIRLVTASGEQVVLAMLGPGDVLGEVGLHSRRRERTADAEALDAVAALVVRRADFDRLRRSNPEVDDFVLELMARRIDRLSHQVAEAYRVPADVRVARRLYEAGRLYAGEPGPPRVPLTQQHLAGLAGTTRPTVNEALQALVAAGVVRLGRGLVEIVDVRALRARCDADR